jgi:hypothetical protein
MKSTSKKTPAKAAAKSTTKTAKTNAKKPLRSANVKRVITKNLLAKSDETPKEFQPFGGSLLKNSNAKTPRPLSTKHPIHVVLRSSAAKGKWSLKKPTNAKIVEETFKQLASDYEIKVHESFVANDQVHLLIQLGDLETFAPFIRSLSGTIAIKVTGANKLAGLKEKFWDFRPWSRIVAQKRGYSLLKDYAG